MEYVKRESLLLGARESKTKFHNIVLFSKTAGKHANGKEKNVRVLDDNSVEAAKFDAGLFQENTFVSILSHKIFENFSSKVFKGNLFYLKISSKQIYS